MSDSVLRQDGHCPTPIDCAMGVFWPCPFDFKASPSPAGIHRALEPRHHRGRIDAHNGFIGPVGLHGAYWDSWGLVGSWGVSWVFMGPLVNWGSCMGLMGSLAWVKGFHWGSWVHETHGRLVGSWGARMIHTGLMGFRWGFHRTHWFIWGSLMGS